MNPLFIKNKYAGLKKGYPVYINDVTVRGYTAKPGADIEVGSLLVRTDTPKLYESVQNKSAAVTDANEITGIAMATNVQLNRAYPGGDDPTSVPGGTQGDNAFIGEIPVEFVGDAPDENAPVYLITVAGTDPDALKGLVTANSTTSAALGTKLLLPQFKFTGLTDEAGTLTVIRKLY